MSFQRGAACPPAVEVERHSAGESIDPSWRTHIEGCANCTSYARELTEAASVFLKARPAELFLRQVERRAQTHPKRPVLSWVLSGVGALALASLALVVAPKLLASDEVRFKGGDVEVYFKREGMAEAARVLEGARLEPGDTLRFRYRGLQSAHLAVIEQDRSGAVTVFAPFGGTHSVRLDSGQFSADAVTLDATTGPAKLFIIHGSKGFELAPLVDAVKRSGELGCDGCAVEVLHYEKLP
ncbi:MAG: hypothetical protein ACYC8T_12620 [Myxococcaceae bacterium]